MIRLVCVLSLMLNPSMAMIEDSHTPVSRAQRSEGSESTSEEGDSSGDQASASRSFSPSRRLSPKPSSAEDININPSDMFWNKYACLMIGGSVFAGLVWVFK